MSKQIGLIKVKGNLDGVSFYQSDGENFVRMAKGPDKKRILTDPAFQRTRENNREFGASAKVAKSFRAALTPVIKLADRRLTSRALTLFKEMNSKGPGLRGQRSIEISKFGAILEKLELNERIPLGGLFRAPFVNEHSAARNTGSLVIPAFEVGEFVHATPGATHFRLVHVIGVVSDYSFSTATGRYEPVEPKLDSIYAANYSDYLPLQNGMSPPITLNVVLPGAPALTAKTSVIQGMGILYYQERGSLFYPLKQANAFQIVGVF